MDYMDSMGKFRSPIFWHFLYQNPWNPWNPWNGGFLAPIPWPPQVLVKEAAEKLQTVQDTVAKVRWTSLGDEGNMDQVWGFYDGNVGET
jgi:hypothetical protein